MATIEDSRCPVCESWPGTLTLTETLTAEPIAQPVVSCSICGVRLVGTWDADGEHVTFPGPLY